MASNSSKPNSPKNSKDRDNETLGTDNPEKLTEDLNFWSMDTDVEAADVADVELDEVAEFLKSPVLPIGKKTKTLSEISNTPTELQELDDDGIIEKLEKANSREETNTARALSDEDLEEFKNLEHEEILAVENQKNIKSNSTKKRTPLELAASTICILFLIGLGIYFYNYYNNHFDILTDDKWTSNIPVEGKYAEIEAVDTWWSEPVTQAKLGVDLVPCIKITLGEGAKSGALRVIFYSFEEGLNGNLRAKGDPFPLEFSNGKFANGKNSVIIQGTDGFESMAEFYEYRNQMEDRWTVSIKEGSTIDIRSADFENLGHAPIEPTYKTLQTAK